MRKLLFILAVLCLARTISPTPGFCQTTPPTGSNGYMRTDLISPSPTAANLGRYGNVPVTYYTGMPNVSIPIFTVEGTDLKLPITLTYNYNGFKPMEEASWVGLGWSLQAGGVITRTLGDKVDEDYTGTYKYQKSANLTNLGSQTYLTNAYKNAMYDLAPDHFSFNFAGYSGQFILYEDSCYVTPVQTLVVSGTADTGFIIVTEDGTTYEFTAQEISMSKSTGYEPYIIPAYPSSWHLTKITNAAGTESISLEYATEGPIYQYGTMVQSWAEHLSGYVSGGSNPTAYSASVLSSPIAAFSTKVSNAKRLIAIHSEKHNVAFNVDDVYRQDIDGNAALLKSIVVSSTDNKKIKVFNFGTEYFQSGSSKFLKLKKLVQYDTAEANYFQHEFEYENESSTGGSNASYVDHYGYLRANSNMPSNYFPSSIYPGSGTNREPVFDYAKSGALKRIKYPTGGSTDLEYEQNTYYDGQKYNYSYLNTGTTRTVSGLQNQTIQQVDTFSANFAQNISLYVSRSPKITPGDPNTEVDHTSTYEVKLELIHYVDGVEDYYESIGTYKIDWNYENGGKSFSIAITQPGVYRITTRCDPTENSVSASVSAQKRFQLGPIEGKGGAGIRIKKITENPGIGLPIVRNYYYTDSLGFTTGEGLGEPMYNYQALTRTVLNAQMVLMGTVQMADHTSMVSEAPERGLPFYYKQVVEDVVSGSSVSRTKYFFNHVSGHNEADLVRQEEFKQESGNFVKVRQIINTYGAPGLNSFTGISVVKTEELIYDGVGDPIVTYDWVASGTKYIVWKYPISSKTTLYSGTDSLVSETVNFYNYTTHNRIGVKTKNSDGSTYYTKYKYPIDYQPAVTGSLINANVVTPVEEQIWRKSPAGDSAMIAGKIFKYNSSKKIEKIYAFESASGITSLNSETKSSGLYNTLISDSRYKSKIDFVYHSSGKVTSQQLTNDLPVSYLWAYAVNSQAGSANAWYNYPVAEIKNATTSEVFYSSFEQSGSLLQAKTGRRSYSGVYTIVGTFTGEYKLSYWKKTGSGAWQLFETVITNPSNVQIGASGSYVDEVRLYPTKAILKTFTYLNGWGLSDVNDANNVITHFKYDAFGRLMSIRDDKGNILSNYQYNYKNSGSAD